MSKFGFDRKIAAWPEIKRRAMERLAHETRDYFIKSFEIKRWDGQKWEKLAKSTVKDKVRKGYPTTPLVRTGKLKKTVQQSIKSITPSRIVFESDAVDDRGRHYSDFQNDGTLNMPPRTFMPRNYIEQPATLTALQLKILRQETGKIWRLTT